VSSGGDGAVRFWDVVKQEEIAEFPGVVGLSPIPASG
jgi:hypothetical protein